MDPVLDLPPDLDSAWRARRFVQRVLSDQGVEGETAWTVTLVAHELVTNAVQHARTDFTLRVDIGPDSVRVEVHDDNPRRPLVTTPPRFATSGRGLALVTSLADDWGVEADLDSKVVWATLRRRDLEGDPPSSRSRLAGHWQPSGQLSADTDGVSISA